MIPQIPGINFDTNNLYELGGLEREDTEPLVKTDQELQTLLPQPLELDLPLSTVAVGCAVKATPGVPF